MEEGHAARAILSARGTIETIAQISWVGMESVGVAFLPGEPVAGVGIRIRTGHESCLSVVAYTDGAPGYIFLPQDEAEGGYEVLASPISGIGGARLVRAVRALVETVSTSE
jgi:hypothetical protein